MFGYLVGIPDLAKGKYVTDVDLDQCALCQAGRDEQAEPISRNINYLDRPTVKHERSQAAQETGLSEVRKRGSARAYRNGHRPFSGR